MHSEEVTKKRQYHFTSLHRLVREDSRVRVLDTRVDVPSPRLLHEIDAPNAAIEEQERRRAVMSEAFGASIDWREIKFVRFDDGGVIYVNIIEKATGKVIRTVKQATLEAMSEAFKMVPGSTLNISG